MRRRPRDQPSSLSTTSLTSPLKTSQLETGNANWFVERYITNQDFGREGGLESVDDEWPEVALALEGCHGDGMSNVRRTREEELVDEIAGGNNLGHGDGRSGEGSIEGVFLVKTKNAIIPVKCTHSLNT